jgi:polysaccharide export outer membrane protein
MAVLFAASCSASKRKMPDSVPAHVAETERLNEQLVLMAKQSDAAEYRVGPEDLLEVTLFDIASVNGEPQVVTARVSSGGFVTLPHIGKVIAEGFTPLEFEQHLREKYQRFIHEPQLSVFIKEYRSYRVSVIGYVEDPGVLQLEGRRTLLEALALAGGLTDEAGRTVRFRRQTGDQVITELIDLSRLAVEGDPRLNPILLPDDVIHVPRAGVFYVEGMVHKAGAYPLLQETTVTQAIATAGGPDVDLANLRGTTLFRKREDGDRDGIPLDIAAIRRGSEPDLEVQEDDVIVIPVSGPKYVFDKFLGLVRLGIGLKP